MNVAPIEDGFVSISMTTYSVQEFLIALAPGPIDGSDEMALRICGRPQDLTVDDEAWQFEASVYPPGQDSGLELFITVNIPEDDVPEVVRRLGG
jgi:hypothetical protein